MRRSWNWPSALTVRKSQRTEHVRDRSLSPPCGRRHHAKSVACHHFGIDHGFGRVADWGVRQGPGSWFEAESPACLEFERPVQNDNTGHFTRTRIRQPHEQEHLGSSPKKLGGGMAIGARQIYALLRLARMPDGSKPLSDFLEDLDRSEASAASLFAQGLVMGARTPLGQITVTITEAGRDLLSPPADHYAFGLE
jgi:hypothetical protein